MAERRAILRSPSADVDLLDIWLSIAAGSIGAADRQIDRLDESISRLARFPQLGVARPEIARDLRILTVAPYLVMFRLVAGDIEVVRVVHGARDLGALDLS